MLSVQPGLLCEDSIDSHIMGILEYKKEQFKVFANDSFSGQESLMFDEKTVKTNHRR